MKTLQMSLCLAGILISVSHAETKTMCSSGDVYDGWRLGVQCWTLKNMTLFEAIDQAKALGLKWIEAFPGQAISPQIKDGFGPDNSDSLRQQVRQKLEEAGVDVKTFGVYGMPDDEAGARKAFEFAKAMGIETIISEPSFEVFEMLDRLCQEYKIRLAIHNHPKPTRYWDPEIAYGICQKTSNWIGVCPDTGHWVRSGLDPVESLRKFEGRIFDVHLKEIENDTDLVWGRGQNRAEAALKELHRQGYKGPIIIEYEHHWEEDFIPDLRRCIAYYTQTAAGLASANWADVFEAGLGNADMKPGSWILENGVLIRKGDGDVWTKKTYKDFILDFEFKVEKGTNSGVFLRAREHTWLPWVEVQIMDSYDGKPVERRDTCGAIYDILAPEVNAVKPAGQWNRMTIQAVGPMILVVLNGQRMIDMNLDNWTEAHKNPDGSENKFDVAYKDLPREGFLGFQDHGFAVEYRNLKIKELN
jgi:sugar phosphate isomerase/epimerase